MAVVREGSNRTVEATLRERASSNDGVGDSGKRSQNISGHLQGVTLSDLDNNARSQFNLSAELKGALAAEVLQDSAAFQAGLRQGDVIIEVDRKKVSSSPEALKLIESRKDKTTLLRVWSGGVTHFVAIRNGE
jgi:serine protease Do